MNSRIDNCVNRNFSKLFYGVGIRANSNNNKFEQFSF